MEREKPFPTFFLGYLSKISVVAKAEMHREMLALGWVEWGGYDLGRPWPQWPIPDNVLLCLWDINAASSRKSLDPTTQSTFWTKRRPH